MLFFYKIVQMISRYPSPSWNMHGTQGKRMLTLSELMEFEGCVGLLKGRQGRRYGVEDQKLDTGWSPDSSHDLGITSQRFSKKSVFDQSSRTNGLQPSQLCKCFLRNSRLVANLRYDGLNWNLSVLFSNLFHCYCSKMVVLI